MRGAPSVLAAEALAAHLRSGGAAVFPTDTLPALASLPQYASGLWRLKERPSEKPLILMAAGAEELFAALGRPLPPQARQLAESCWPGALTLVLPAVGPVVEQLHPGGSSLGLRIPASALALELLRLSGPLATTSCNRSGEVPSLSAEQAACCFPGVPQLAPLPWPAPSGQGSTVVAWEAGQWRLLRQGGVPLADLPLA